jgi:dolichol-phosphate mannosyltransferase
MPQSAKNDRQSTEGPAPTAAPSVSVIVPTYREAGNLPELIRRLEQVRIASELPLELLIVDDDSADGTAEVVKGLNHDWVRLIVRKDARDLSSAVLEGLRQAHGEIAVVMDADLSHPPETIPRLMRAIADGADFAIGSRYVAGGSTDAAWGPLRWLNSRIATWLARPLTAAKDPMSGFFAIRRERVGCAVGLDPIGYKIGLELLVRCGCRDVREVPIHFADRKAGKSKLSFKQQVRYVRHLKRLMWFKYGPKR